MPQGYPPQGGYQGGWWVGGCMASGTVCSRGQALQNSYEGRPGKDVRIRQAVGQPASPAWSSKDKPAWSSKDKPA